MHLNPHSLVANCLRQLVSTNIVNAAMKDQTRILESLKLYLEYLRQDDTCNCRVIAYVEKEIQKMEAGNL